MSAGPGDPAPAGDGARPGVVVRLVTDRATLDAARALRHEVFVIGQGVPAGLERDAADSAATHGVVELDGRVVATGRLLDEQGVARFGRICTAEDVRGTGAGVRLMELLERAALRAGLPTGVLHAQLAVVGFYRRLGWQPHGEPDVEAGIAHQWMVKDLVAGLRPATDADGPGLIELIGSCWSEYPGCVLDVDAEEPWLRAPATAYAARGGGLWVVGPASGPRACVAVRPAGERIAELKSLYVASGARRSGLGGRLVAWTEGWAVRADRPVVQLWTDTRFTDAHRLYARAGYEPTGRRRDLHDLSATTEIEFRRTIVRWPVAG